MRDVILQEWYASIYDVVDAIKIKGLVLCGTGKWMQYAAELFSLFGVTPECACYQDTEGEVHSYANVLVLTYEDAKRDYPDSIYITCADSNGERDRWNRLLKKDSLLSKESGVVLWRYAFLLDTGLQADNDTVLRKDKIVSDNCNKFLFLNHMIHSGTGYLQELMDGDENIITVPALTSTWIRLYDNRFKYLYGKKLWIEICAQMAKYFDTSLGRKGLFPEETLINMQMGFKDENGDLNWDIMIHPGVFYGYLKNELSEERYYSFGEILKAVFASYANTVGKDVNDKFWIVYDVHDQETPLSAYDKYHLENEFETIRSLFVIRNPLNHLNAVIKAYVLKGSDDLKRFVLDKRHIMKFIRTDCGVYLGRKDNLDGRVVRFEDLKADKSKMLEKIFDYLELPLSDSDYIETFNGVAVRKNANTKNDNKSIVDKGNFVFTEYDSDRLSFLFKDFINTYYSDDSDGTLAFSEEEMTENYDILEYLIAEILRIGDVNEEAGNLREQIAEEVAERLKQSIGADELCQMI